jgi:hypothetical protein
MENKRGFIIINQFNFTIYIVCGGGIKEKKIVKIVLRNNNPTKYI